MLSRGICNGFWKIEKSPCRSGKDSLYLLRAAETAFEKKNLILNMA